MIGRLSFDLITDLSRSPEMEVIPFPVQVERELSADGGRRARLPGTVRGRLRVRAGGEAGQ